MAWMSGCTERGARVSRNQSQLQMRGKVELQVEPRLSVGLTGVFLPASLYTGCATLPSGYECLYLQKE